MKNLNIKFHEKQKNLKFHKKKIFVYNFIKTFFLEFY